MNNNSASPKWVVKSKFVETTTFDYPKDIPLFICRFIDELLTGIQHRDHMVAFTRDPAVPLAVFRWMLTEAQKVVDQFKYEPNDNLTRANMHSALVDVLYYQPKATRVCLMGAYLDSISFRCVL